MTDGRTDRILITIPRLHYMQRGKIEMNSISVNQVLEPAADSALMSGAVLWQVSRCVTAGS